MTAIYLLKTDLLTHVVTKRGTLSDLLNINIKITGNYTTVKLFQESDGHSGCGDNSLWDIQREEVHINIDIDRQAVLNILKYFHISFSLFSSIYSS